MAKPKPKKKKEAPTWRNRIVGHEVIDAEQLLANPDNYRIHPKNQQAVMEGVLDTIGWIDEVKVNKNTGFVVDGHMRAALAISRNETVPVTYLDLTKEEEALALASYNPIAAMAVHDAKMLNSLIEGINIENPDVGTFLDGLYAEANESSLKEESSSSRGDRDEEVEAKASQVRVLLFIGEVEMLEQAIIKTGAGTRGAALGQICKFYLTGGQTESGEATGHRKTQTVAPH